MTDIGEILMWPSKVKGDCLMKERGAIVPLSDADEAVCAFFIENPTALRRVVHMMPHGDPPLDFLQKLWFNPIVNINENNEITLSII